MLYSVVLGLMTKVHLRSLVTNHYNWTSIQSLKDTHAAHVLAISLENDASIIIGCTTISSVHACDRPQSRNS